MFLVVFDLASVCNVVSSCVETALVTTVVDVVVVVVVGGGGDSVVVVISVVVAVSCCNASLVGFIHSVVSGCMGIGLVVDRVSKRTTFVNCYMYRNLL